MSLGAKLASSMIKYIGDSGITAAKKKFGNSKTNGVAALSDEQLGKGLNMFEKKKAEKKAVKAPKPKAKKSLSLLHVMWRRLLRKKVCGSEISLL